MHCRERWLYRTYDEYEMDACSTEGNMLKRAPKSTNVHHLEEAHKTYRDRQEKANLSLASRTFGIGFSLHLQHERAAASCPQIGHLGFLKRHDALHHSLTGRDLDFDFSDTLAFEPEFNASTYKVMDNMQSKYLSRK